MPSHIRVPVESLSREALEGLVEEFITREGTDYGEREFSLQEKRSQLLRQLSRGEIAIVFALEGETTTLVSKQELARLAAD